MILRLKIHSLGIHLHHCRHAGPQISHFHLVLPSDGYGYRRSVRVPLLQFKVMHLPVATVRLAGDTRDGIPLHVLGMSIVRKVYAELDQLMPLIFLEEGVGYPFIEIISGSEEEDLVVPVGNPKGWLPLFGEHGFEGEPCETVAAVLDHVEGWEGGEYFFVDVHVLGFGDFETLGEFGWWCEGLIVQKDFPPDGVLKG